MTYDRILLRIHFGSNLELVSFDFDLESVSLHCWLRFAASGLRLAASGTCCYSKDTK